MDQTHLGYYSWFSPAVNIEPPVAEVVSPDTSDFGVATQGTRPNQQDNHPSLPALDSLHPSSVYFEVFPVGLKAMQVTVKAREPWIRLKEGVAFSSGKADRRFWVDVDWSQLGDGLSTGTVMVQDGAHTVRVQVPAMKATAQQRSEASGAFGSLAGPISFNASDVTKLTSTGEVHWAEIPDYGREGSAMTIFPVTAASIAPGRPAPTMEYDLFVPKAGEYQIDLVTNPTLDLHPGRPLSVGVAMDGKHLQTKSVFTPATAQSETFLGRNFNKNTSDNTRVMHFQQSIDTPGRHKLELVMVDPTVVVEKVIVHLGDLPQSFFGPPAKEKIP